VRTYLKALRKIWQLCSKRVFAVRLRNQVGSNWQAYYQILCKQNRDRIGIYRANAYVSCFITGRNYKLL
jgi:hypothetical protein